MRETKRKFLCMQIYDHTGIKTCLEQMALQGWKLEKIGGMGAYHFRRMEPSALQYSVAYFLEASEFDSEPTVRQREFIELCEQSGWEYIDSTAQMLVFCSKQPNPMPIETDAMMQVETIHKAMKRNFLPGQYVMLGVAVLQLLIFGYRIVTEPVNVLLQNGLLMSLGCYALMFVLCVYHMGNYYLWRRKALSAAEDGVFVETKGSAAAEKAALAAVTAMFVLWLFSMLGEPRLLYVTGYTFAVMGVYIALIFGAKALLKKCKVSRETNRRVTFGAVVVGSVLLTVVLVMGIMHTDVGDSAGEIPENVVDTYVYDGRVHYVYDDPIPLTLADLGVEADYAHRSRVQDVQTSLLMTVYNGQEIAPWGTDKTVPELYYTLTIPRFEVLLELCAEDVLDDRRIRSRYGESSEVNPELWQAERVYAYSLDGQSSGYYTIIWEDRIAEISLPAAPTEEQIRIITEYLKTYEP